MRASHDVRVCADTFVLTTLALLGISIYLLFGWDLFTRNFMYLVEVRAPGERAGPAMAGHRPD